VVFAVVVNRFHRLASSNLRSVTGYFLIISFLQFPIAKGTECPLIMSHIL
jgi:hypothetical protein